MQQSQEGEAEGTELGERAPQTRTRSAVFQEARRGCGETWGVPLVQQLALPACMAGPSPWGPSTAAGRFVCHTGEPSHRHLGTEQRASKLVLCLLHAHPVSHPAPWLDTSSPRLPGGSCPPQRPSFTQPPHPDPKPEDLFSLPRAHSLCEESASTLASKPACSPGPSDPVSS